MMETQDAQVRSEGIPPLMRAEGGPMKETLRKQGPVIALATALLASYALVLSSIFDLRADFRAEMTELRQDFRAGMTDLRQDFRAEFKKVDARFERMDARFEWMDVRFERVDARLYELNERVARIEGHLGLTEAPAAETSSLPIPSPASEQAFLTD